MLAQQLKELSQCLVDKKLYKQAFVVNKILTQLVKSKNREYELLRGVKQAARLVRPVMSDVEYLKDKFNWPSDLTFRSQSISGIKKAAFKTLCLCTHQSPEVFANDASWDLKKILSYAEQKIKDPKMCFSDREKMKGAFRRINKKIQQNFDPKFAIRESGKECTPTLSSGPLSRLDRIFRKFEQIKENES